MQELNSLVKVSVIIPTRDRAILLKDAIESVLAVERHDFDLEIIVVDDGSTDDTASVARKYPVLYLQTPCVGPSGARNAGILAAKGNFIAFLDDDDVWLPNNIGPQIRMFSANPSYGMVHAQVCLTGPDLKATHLVMPDGVLPSGWIFRDILSHKTQLAAVLIRRDVLSETGLFDETLRDGEDWDLLLRIAQHYQIGRLRVPVALFRQRCDNNEEYDFRSMRATLTVFRRHTITASFGQRLALRTILWRHRGWYAAAFVRHAQAHVSFSDNKRAWRSLWYSFVASPPHVLFRQPAVWSTVGRLFIRLVVRMV